MELKAKEMGDKIRQLRESLTDLTIDELAAEVVKAANESGDKVSESAVSRIERGYRMPSIMEAFAIAKVLNISPNELLGLDKTAEESGFFIYDNDALQVETELSTADNEISEVIIKSSDEVIICTVKRRIKK